MSRSSSAGLRSASALGIAGNNTIAVASEMLAVSAFNAPSDQYDGVQTVSTAITCVRPHATMNAPNILKIHRNGTSVRLRTKYRSINGIEKYESAISESETTCSPRSCGCHKKQ